MPIEEFIGLHNLPGSWQNTLHVEMLTGCSKCGHRLLSMNNAGAYVLPGVVVVRVYDEHDEFCVAYALCDACGKGVR